METFPPGSKARAKSRGAAAVRVAAVNRWISRCAVSAPELVAGGRFPELADALTTAVRKAADHGDHVTPDQFKAGLAELDAWIANAETRLTRRFARAMLAQTGVILAAIFGAAIAILRMLG